MINEIEKMEMPVWLSGNDLNFDIRTILDDSLYYPCAGFDGDPVKYFMGNIFSFVYVDYGVARDGLLEEIETQGFQGYHIIHNQAISQSELIPNDWTVQIRPEQIEKKGGENLVNNWIKEPFCQWLIFERDQDKDDTHNPRRFSLLYLCADGIAAYQALYLSNNIKPKIVAIIQPGTGFGHNWTDFTNRNGLFAKSVFYNTELLPDYIINGGWGKLESYKSPIWDEYKSSIVTLNTGRAVLNLWKRTLP